MSIIQKVIYMVIPVENTGLKLLDLSWNHLRLVGAVSICKGLQVSRFALEHDTVTPSSKSTSEKSLRSQ